MQLAIAATNGDSTVPDEKARNGLPITLTTAGSDSGVESRLSCRMSSVVVIDFGEVSINNDQSPWPFNKLSMSRSIYMPPLLRWHDAWWSDHLHEFETWIDWEWQLWLEEQYRHMQRDITDEIRSRWLPDKMLEKL
jgi:hypothetical protein